MGLMSLKPYHMLCVNLIILWSSLRTSHSVNPYCSKAYFWHADNTRTPGGDDWSTYAENSAFETGPCLGLSGIGVTETYKKTILVIDRSVVKNGYLTLPGQPDRLAFAQELDLSTGEQRGLNVLTNTFCSSGQHFVDGSFISIGGDWSPDYAAPGEFSLRSFAPCTNQKCDFEIVDNLTKSRWYPTSALLGDGRIIIVGGSSRGVSITTPPDNVPYIEYYPKKPGVAYEAPFLVESLPYNLFPYVNLLPSGKVFLFAGEKWTLWDTVANAAVPGKYPPVGAVDSRGARLMQSYPMAGTSAMLPLSSTNGYKAEIIICGGGGTPAIYLNATGGIVEDTYYESSNQCFRIFPEGKNPAWIPEKPMRYPRVMPVGVLLPDGHFLVIGGTKSGHSGLGFVAHNATLTPELYDSTTHTWYPKPLATSKVARAYHASATLMHDGRVFVSGSNPNTEIIGGPAEFPTELRTEFFVPPYAMKGVLSPVLVTAPAAAAYGSIIPIAFKSPAGFKKLKVVMAQPGFSTHGYNHGMRNVELDVKGIRSNGNMHVAQVAIPINRNLLPPTWYWIFVVVDGIPNREGHYVFIKAKLTKQ